MGEELTRRQALLRRHARNGVQRRREAQGGLTDTKIEEGGPFPGEAVAGEAQAHGPGTVAGPSTESGIPEASLVDPLLDEGEFNMLLDLLREEEGGLQTGDDPLQSGEVVLWEGDDGLMGPEEASASVPGGHLLGLRPLDLARMVRSYPEASVDQLVGAVLGTGRVSVADWRQLRAVLEGIVAGEMLLAMGAITAGAGAQSLPEGLSAALGTLCQALARPGLSPPSADH